MATLKIIGLVRSPLELITDCPLQENEQAPAAVLMIRKKYLTALNGLIPGARIVIFTWLHKANRKTLVTKPRNNPNADTKGIFATRSPDRPNPIGMHVTDIISITKGKIKIANLEVLDRTPIIDIKPFLG